MKLRAHPRNPTSLLVAILLPVFLAVSVISSNTYDARKQDFAAYWQAGHMILAGQDVYDSSQWIAERELHGTALHSELTFHYPLPFAVLFSPLALFPVQTSYTFWLFLQQTLLMTSVLLLLRLCAMQEGYLTVFALAGVFLFRPAFSVIFNGQIFSVLLLAVVLSIYLFRDGNWFWGGLVVSILLLKPSIGVPILAFTCLWFLVIKQGMGIAGVMAGGALLFLIGAMVDPHWVSAYLQVGQASFSKYLGLHPTLWGLVDKAPIPENARLQAGMFASAVVIGVETFYLWRRRFEFSPLTAVSSSLPAGLLLAPYSWNYDQILLVVPLIYLTAKIAGWRGARAGLSFLFGMVILSIVLVLIAYALLHDVWSIWNSLTVWALALMIRPVTGNAVINVTP